MVFVAFCVVINQVIHEIKLELVMLVYIAVLNRVQYTNSKAKVEMPLEMYPTQPRIAITRIINSIQLRFYI